ncbi:MAG: S49 family peptidase [Prevotellaceae bacterium]|jgi:protease-4|nr:S49 family peptidase [Prevotellaceae bacterium]
MHYSFIKEIITSSWQIDTITLQQYAPLLRGILTLGLQFEREDADEICKSYRISAETPVKNQDSRKLSVFVQPVKGILMKNDTNSGIIGTKTMAKNLLAADKDSNIIGHILFIESGGGQSSAVPELSDAIKQLTKPIVAFVDGCMCSAAMYVGSYCQQIIASRQTDSIGCIGTMVEISGFPKFNKEPDGYTYVRIYADDATEKNDEFETALTGDFKLIKERILNPANQQFVNDIKTNRPNARDEHLKGRTFKASEVVGILIDSIGDFKTAVDAVIELSKSKNNNHNSKNMTENKMKLTALPAVLALTELAFEDGQTSLNEEQIEAIDVALSAGNKATAELASANENLQNANNTIAERDATVKTLNEEIAALKKQPGAAPAEAVDEPDGEQTNVYCSVRDELKGKK